MKFNLNEIKNTGTRVISMLFEPDFPETPSVPDLHDAVEQARHEWLCAQNYYNSVSDQDLVDHAVYLMQAAEKKYIYLLKQARAAGITYTPYETYHQ